MDPLWQNDLKSGKILALLESHLVVNNHPVHSIPYENVFHSEVETESSQELDLLDSNLLNT